MRFVRGLRTFVGFRQTGLDYERSARGSGRPKYSLKSLVGLAIDGVVSFSSYPLRLMTGLGLGTAGLAVLMTIWVFVDAFVHHTAPRGWASVIVTVLFLGSLRLIFLETKGRPSYIISERRPAAGLEILRGPHRVDAGEPILGLRKRDDS
jgi:dolichol-phosphate mannosyltransferase